MLMLSAKVGECITQAIEDPEVNRMLKNRENHSDLTFKSVYSKVMRHVHNRTCLSMVVRIGFDFDENQTRSKEDIWVDVKYYYEYVTKREIFDVQKPHCVPELPDPVRTTAN